jgi:hypothetical protein
MVASGTSNMEPPDSATMVLVTSSLVSHVKKADLPLPYTPVTLVHV